MAYNAGTPPKVPVSPSMSSLAYDDDWTLYSDEHSIYSLSNASTDSFATIDSFASLPPFRLPQAAGHKRAVYEAWNIYLSPDTKEVRGGTKLFGFNVMEKYHQFPGITNITSELYDQSELMDMHFGALDKYQAEHKRCWPSRMVRGKAKTYEEDLDERMRKLPDPVQSEINRLLADREDVTSSRLHSRAWTVVMLREQLHRRFAAANPTEVKHHKLRVWKNKLPKNQRLEYFIVIRGSEGKPVTDDTKGHRAFRRYENPWKHADEAEIRQKQRERHRKQRDRRKKQRQRRMRQYSSPPAYRARRPVRMHTAPPPPPPPMPREFPDPMSVPPSSLPPPPPGLRPMFHAPRPAPRGPLWPPSLAPPAVPTPPVSYPTPPFVSAYNPPGRLPKQPFPPATRPIDTFADPVRPSVTIPSYDSYLDCLASPSRYPTGPRLDPGFFGSSRTSYPPPPSPPPPPPPATVRPSCILWDYLPPPPPPPPSSPPPTVIRTSRIPDDIPPPPPPPPPPAPISRPPSFCQPCRISSSCSHTARARLLSGTCNLPVLRWGTVSFHPPCLLCHGQSRDPAGVAPRPPSYYSPAVHTAPTCSFPNPGSPGATGKADDEADDEEDDVIEEELPVIKDEDIIPVADGNFDEEDSDLETVEIVDD